ncbi:zinc-binding dehydrogenase [Streptomyces sp. MMS24-I2-30]|uniref:zinc-binding dehydrogenase n=1 Tax=Streptomyces sp. MMS24-I2-30 TaxID=3351564 RepID=UPI003896D6FF
MRAEWRYSCRSQPVPGPRVRPRSSRGRSRAVPASWFKTRDRVFGQLLDDPIGYGACAEYVVTSEEPKEGVLVRIPDGLDFATAAALPTAASTALGAVDAVNCGSGEKLLIIGATGGTGVFATRIAAARGVHVIATAAPQADAVVRARSAQDTVDYRARPVGEVVADRWPHGLDGIVDLVGDVAAFEAAAHLKDGRNAVSIDFAATEELQKSGRIRAVNHVHDDKLNRITEVGRMAVEGTLGIVVERRVPLGEAAQAFERNRRGGARGKTVIDMTAG